MTPTPPAQIGHAGPVAVEVLRELGGVSTWGTLQRLVGRAAIERAVRAGDVVVDARGRYSLPTADAARRAANRLSGVVSHRSAVAAWGWEQQRVPEIPEVTVPKHRVLGAERRQGVRVFVADLTPEDVVDGVTSPERTVVDCLRSLPFVEALPIADTALRAGMSSQRLTAVATQARGPGSARVRTVAEAASPLAANVFESVLRGLALQAGLRVRPQVPLYADGFLGQPDLVDADRRLVLEADSFAWHGNRAALRRDTHRYNAFVVHGWLVLRFAWEDVMHDPEYVLRVLKTVAQTWTEGRCLVCGAA